MTKRKIPSLTLEHFQDHSNMLYLSLIEYKKENYLTIIDNIGTTELVAFVLDYTEPEGIDTQWLLGVANIWYYKSSARYPFSMEIARLGLTEKLSPIMKVFDIDNITRVVGLPFRFDTESRPKIKRRRVIPVPACVEIVLKKQSKKETT